MTEKQLRRLSRQDLLQLLLAQSKEVVLQQKSADELKVLLDQERELTERLKTRLDEKDETIEELQTRLNTRDETMKRLKEEARELAASLELLRRNLTGNSETRNVEKTASYYDREETAPLSPAPALGAEDRLKQLKALLSQNEAMADMLRKDQE